MKTNNRLRITVNRDGDKYLWQVFDEVAYNVVGYAHSNSREEAEQGAKNWIVFHGNTGDNGKQALMAHDEIRQAEKEIGAIGGHLAVFLARNVFSGDRRRKNYHAHITKYAHDYKIEQN